ncbi:hypothetical protein [Faecalicatena contorta]|nr:hypothetical protein [Faecalicatena contorta]
MRKLIYTSFFAFKVQFSYQPDSALFHSAAAERQELLLTKAEQITIIK